MPRWSAATARCSRRHDPSRRHGHDRRDRRPGPARAAARRWRWPADRCPTAADRAAPHRDAVDAAAAGGGVLVQHLPPKHGRSAVVDPARHDAAAAGPAGFRAAGGGRGRLDGIAGGPARHRRPGGGDRAAALGGPAGHLGGDHLLGDGGLPGRRGRRVRDHGAPGHLGGPLWWPVAVGAAMVAASCALGFAAGALLRGRFSAPLAAVAVFLALGAGAIAIEHNSTYAQIWPLNVQGALPPDAFGIFSPYLPDLAITQVLLLAGVAVVLLGGLG